MAEEPSNAEWLYAPFEAGLAVDLAQDGARWEAEFRMALHQAGYDNVHGHRRLLAIPKSRPVEGVEYTAPGSPLTSRLWITLDGSRVLIAGDGAKEDRQVLPWVQAVDTATTRLADRLKEFRWVAVVGPAPGNEGRALGLAAPATIGPLQLRPGEVRHVEFCPPSSPSFSWRSRFWSWPAVVSLRSHGYNHEEASRAAVRELSRLCALLSLCWRRAWQLRQGPGEDHGGPVTIPEYGALEEHPTLQEDVRRADVTVPDWVGVGWETLGRDHVARNALNAHYEGLLVKDRHPSLALLAFVASIEAIGKTLRPSAGNRDRFLAGLRLVVSAPELEVLGQAYSNRNETVHEARVHGTEETRGAPPLATFFDQDPATRFETAILGQLERASGNLLRLALTDALHNAQPPEPGPDPFEAWPRGLIAFASRGSPVTIPAPGEPA